MHSYKVNNSYTTYVDYQYYDELRQIWHGKKHAKKATQNKGKSTQDLKLQKTSTAAPLANGKKVVSKYFGEGTVVKTEKGILHVRFGEKIIRFIYPDAIKLGQIKIV